MPMTRKHFIVLAEALSWVNDAGDRYVVACKVADLYKADNSAFDRDRFLEEVKQKSLLRKGAQ